MLPHGPCQRSAGSGDSIVDVIRAAQCDLRRARAEGRIDHIQQRARFDPLADPIRSACGVCVERLTTTLGSALTAS